MDHVDDVMDAYFRITGIIGESYIWLFSLKCYWRDYKLAVSRKGISLNGVYLIWRSLRDLPSCQIKMIAKYSGCDHDVTLSSDISTSMA